MAAEGQLAGERAGPFHWWYLPSWLGLDAPCVVLTWTWAISESSEATLSFRPAAAMFLVVWSIYLLDRLIDVARCSDWHEVTGRLHFGRHYRFLFVAALTACLAGVIAILIAGLPADVIIRG